MTSKELLKHIENAPSFMGGDIRYKGVSQSRTLYLEDIKQIGQDLEVLEALKKHFYEEYQIPTGQHSLLFRINGTPEYKKIKDWLKNERQEN